MLRSGHGCLSSGWRRSFHRASSIFMCSWLSAEHTLRLPVTEKGLRFNKIHNPNQRKQPHKPHSQSHSRKEQSPKAGDAGMHKETNHRNPNIHHLRTIQTLLTDYVYCSSPPLPFLPPPRFSHVYFPVPSHPQFPTLSTSERWLKSSKTSPDTPPFDLNPFPFSLRPLFSPLLLSSRLASMFILPTFHILPQPTVCLFWRRLAPARCASFTSP